MKAKMILLIGLITFFNECRKDDKGCWQAFVPGGQDAPGLVLCDKTKTEAEAAYPQYWFYRQGETKYCWRVQFGTQIYYAYGVPESMANMHMSVNAAYQYTRIDCSSFCHCEWLEKHKSKITGNFGTTTIITETLLSADSCSKLFIGRVIVIRETTDSIITRELRDKQP